ncbi:MAG: benzoate-CoA ligase family protein, partial [Gammaproteobacteria bacterium]
SFGELCVRVNRAGNALKTLGLQPESRVAMIMSDSIDFLAVFWGAIKAGLIPVPINTLLTEEHYNYILSDCRARALVVSASLLDTLGASLDDPAYLQHVVVSGDESNGAALLSDLMADASAELQAAHTCADDVAFWLYSSGSTGQPKGVQHVQSSLVYTAETYGKQVLGIASEDIVYSAAKLFFAYGLGNGMTFPLSVGATTVLTASRPTPAMVMALMQRDQITLYFGVPTLYAAILADPSVSSGSGSSCLRLCVSAGEALPAEIGKRWQELFGVPVIDGVGSTEMLHIFLSNRVDDVNFGTSGLPVPGYSVKLVDDNDADVEVGEIGELVVRGRSSAVGYCNQLDRSRRTFVGEWTYTGDKYVLQTDGYYRFCGRTDDMFKSGGNWVSPFDVEAILISHPSVLEAAVVGQPDEHGNIKPKAFVVLRDPTQATTELSRVLQEHVKQATELWKYPRWIEFQNELPKTATGKIQRFKLRSDE